MPISSTLRGSFPTVGSSECCKIRLHLRPWASSLFWSSETQIANAWFPCLRQKQGEIPERSCCFKCWPLTSEVCRFCSLSWRLSPQGVRLGHPNSRMRVSSASLLSTRLLRSAIPSGLLMPQMVLCLRWKLVKGITVHMSMKKYIIYIYISNLYSSYIFYRMYYMYWNLCFCQSVQCLNRRQTSGDVWSDFLVGWTHFLRLQGDWRAIGPHAGTTPGGWSWMTRNKDSYTDV